MRTRLSVPLLLLLFCACASPLPAQSPLPYSADSTNQQTLDSLTACIRSRHDRLLDAELAALQTNQKGEWLKYLPNLGITYTVAGQPRPALSTNSSLLYQSQRDRKNRQATEVALRKRSALQQDTEIARLQRKWQQLQLAQAEVNTYQEISAIDRELFSLYEQQYANNELTPEAFYLKKRAFLLQNLSYQAKAEKAQTLRFELHDIAGCLSSPTR